MFKINNKNNRTSGNMLEKRKKDLWPRGFCLCHVHGFIEGLWHSEPQVIIAKLGEYVFQKDASPFMKKLLNSNEFVSIVSLVCGKE